MRNELDEWLAGELTARSIRGSVASDAIWTAERLSWALAMSIFAVLIVTTVQRFDGATFSGEALVGFTASVFSIEAVLVSPIDWAFARLRPPRAT